MGKHWKYLGILIYLVCSNLVWGQQIDQQTKFTNYSTSNGLSNANINAISEDTMGFIWLATEDGLNRFNGNSFRKYVHDRSDSLSLPSNVVYKVYHDSRHRMWVGTLEGLSLYNPEVDGFITIPDIDPQPGVRDIYEDQNGLLWLFCDSGGTFRFDPLSGEVLHVVLSEVTGAFVHAFLQDANGNYWFGTEKKGIYIYNRNLELIRHLHLKGGKNDCLPDNQIRTLYLDEESNIWLGTGSHGVLKYTPAENRFSSLPPFLPLDITQVNDFVQDAQKNIWIGTNNGLYRYNTVENTLSAFPSDYQVGQLSSNIINDLHLDQYENLWIGTKITGVDLLPLHAQVFQNYTFNPYSSNSLSYASVLAFAQEGNQGLWIGTDGGGVNFFDGEKYTHFRHQVHDSTSLSGDNVLSLLKDRRGRLWVGTYQGGLNVYQDGKFTRFKHDPVDSTSLASDVIWVLYEDSKGSIWVGMDGGGIDVLDPETLQFHNLGKSSNKKNYIRSVRAIIEGQQGYLWVGALSGLYHISLDDRVLTRLQPERLHPELEKNMILSILPDSVGSLWVGTYGEGLYHYFPAQDSVYLINQNSGLLSNIIYTIQKDAQGYLWVSSDKGLSWIDPSTGKIANFTTQDGLGEDYFNMNASFTDNTGQMYFGNRSGFVVFDPAAIQITRRPVKVLFSDFWLANQKVLPGRHPAFEKHIAYTKQLSLNYKDNMFSIGYEGINFVQKSALTYEYKLEGFDEKWQYAGNQQMATYTNLDPGTYVFKVRAVSPSIQKPQVAQVGIVIRPPWWGTWWFRVLLLTVLLLGLLSFYKLRMRLLKQQNQWLEEKVESRTAEIQAKNQEIVRQSLELMEKNEEILALNAHLEDLVQKRTFELNRANKELRDINNELEIFLYRSSHDFRRPLSTIMGLKALADVYLNDQALSKEIFDKINYTAINMDNMLQKLLMVHEVTLQSDFNHEISLKRVVEEIIQDLQKKLKRHEADIRLDIPEGACFLSNKYIVKIILKNIIENALTFTQIVRQQASIYISMNNGDGYINLSFEDNGIGIHQQVLPHIFEMYYRGTDKSPGNGLGLYVVQKGVDKLNGKIQVVSEYGKGSCFKVFIPMV
ncbi:two-component regulator propeller domain-containing protein [Rapidithrix thailandica]|uniref:histidine kinase n=1 Tax=Rapidithrix thailandica TaxID=413964 RepID=A0AAW9S3V9_9BACT